MTSWADTLYSSNCDMENNKTTAIHCMQKSTNYTDYEGLQRKIFKAFHHISSSSYCFVTFLFKKAAADFQSNNFTKLYKQPHTKSSWNHKVHPQRNNTYSHGRSNQQAKVITNSILPITVFYNIIYQLSSQKRLWNDYSPLKKKTPKNLHKDIIITLKPEPPVLR